MYKFFRKYHKWLGIILAFFIVVFGISGIIMNHRSFFSSTDVNRTWLPKEYRYQNWNNAAVKSAIQMDENSFLIYGNQGIWKTDSTWHKFEDFNAGFPKGIDNRKIFKVLLTKNGLLAGTLFGFYLWDELHIQWKKIELPVKEENVVDMLEKGDSIFIMTRSNILLTSDLKHFKTLNLPNPENYDQKISLFKTLWVIHSGEIYGIPGKLIVDFIAVIYIFLSIGGLLIFLFKKKIKNKSLEKSDRKKAKHHFKWNLRWHNKIGWITAIILIITALTGMFLRPPFLISIAESKVGKIPFTELDTPGAWFDILRRMVYLPEEDKFIISTSEGFYLADGKFKNELKFMDNQPPASVMGVNVFQLSGKNELMVGSFEGLFSWNYKTGDIFDLMKNEKYIRPAKKGPPVGDYKITGYTHLIRNQEVVFEYEKGIMLLNGQNPGIKMPDEIIKKSPVSLWNLALELHTGRFFRFLMGPLYILIVPLVGLISIFLIVSGVIVWYKFHR